MCASIFRMLYWKDLTNYGQFEWTMVFYKLEAKRVGEV
jgi:hypothetical protein